MAESESVSESSDVEDVRVRVRAHLNEIWFGGWDREGSGV